MQCRIRQASFTSVTIPACTGRDTHIQARRYDRTNGGASCRFPWTPRRLSPAAASSGSWHPQRPRAPKHTRTNCTVTPRGQQRNRRRRGHQLTDTAKLASAAATHAGQAPKRQASGHGGVGTARERAAPQIAATALWVGWLLVGDRTQPATCVVDLSGRLFLAYRPLDPHTPSADKNVPAWSMGNSR